ncbi:MAG: glycosyltransferase family 2 protein [Ignavibacteriae bacterium]|nr:glycosyltransferase family 2 protein [Ignavibacteriota bacterium]
MNHLEKENSVCAIIPFYNEEKNLAKLVNEVQNYVDFIIAVDDGSTDNSFQQISNIKNILIEKHNANLGKGTALRTGLQKSIELKTKYAITLDADYQHVPEFIPKFIEALKEKDCAIGNRLHNQKVMPLMRRVSNFLTSKMLSVKTGKKILDSQSGYRAFRTEILKDILPNFTGFEAESEMIVKLVRQNYSLGFVNIPTIYGEDDDSKMKAIPAILGFIKVILKV